MKRNKYKDYLWYTAIAVFVICVLEGIFYYHSVESPFLKVMLNIQNAIKAYRLTLILIRQMHLNMLGLRVVECSPLFLHMCIA